jgi:hypothetical protein
MARTETAASLHRLEIDINARTVLPSQRIWRLFPGGSYRFLDDFITNDVGYLDFPGLQLPEGPLSKAGDLIPRLTLALSVKAGVESELKLEDFLDARITQNRGRLRQAIINLYEGAKQHDLVILPTPMSQRVVWIGEIVSNKVEYHQYYRSTIDAKVPCRQIKWIKNVRENTLSSPLSESLRQQHPFTLIENSTFPEVFSIAYTSFVYNNMYSSSVFNGDDFLDADSAFLGTITKLSAAACEATDNNRDGLKIDILDTILSPQYSLYVYADKRHSLGWLHALYRRHSYRSCGCHCRMRPNSAFPIAIANRDYRRYC